MEWKPSEILIVVIALAIPTSLFAALFIPGIMGGLFGFIFAPENMQIVFTVMAMIVAGILGWRVYRRIRPAKPSKPGEENSIAGLFRDPNKS